MMKTCCTCGEELPLSEFYKHPKGRHGVGSKCKDCTKTYVKVWREENRERALATQRRAHFKRAYGLSIEEVEELCQECEACGSTENLHVDHSHETGKVRGCLCSNCNTALGLLNDNPDRILSLMAYALKHSAVAA